jgi:environmental stress-induced protein Ves
VILVAASDATPVPWKNGGGVTRELLRLPADSAADWTLRISVADIDADGPFSPFPGITRWFAVLAGTGVRLSFPDRVLNVAPHDLPLCFDGADAPGCALLDGATRDLNVMVRSDRGTAAISVASARDETRALHCAGLGFFALRPVRLHGAAELPVDMPALSLLWLTAPFAQPRPWSIESSPTVGADAAGATDRPGYWISLNSPPPCHP